MSTEYPTGRSRIVSGARYIGEPLPLDVTTWRSPSTQKVRILSGRQASGQEDRQAGGRVGERMGGQAARQATH